jgi:hypothetical protein
MNFRILWVKVFDLELDIQNESLTNDRNRIGIETKLKENELRKAAKIKKKSLRFINIKLHIPVETV